MHSPARLHGAEGAATVPLAVGDDALGVLYVEGETPRAFTGLAGLLRTLGMSSPAQPALELVYYQADDTVLCDSHYLVKGAPGRILWSMLKAHVRAGRTQFSNRELRLDESLGLPAGNDNLEARLLVLRRRLADLGCGIMLERVGRGRLELTLDRPATLTVVPTTGPMRDAPSPA
jgi:hypothetical protein